MIHITRIIPAVLALLFIAGCETTSYEYVAPVSDQGRMCVTQCAGIKETCRGNELRQAQRGKESCERTNDIKLSACLSKASNKDQRDGCDKERNRNSCWTSDTTYRCEKEYRSCFVNCGGAVIETRK